MVENSKYGNVELYITVLMGSTWLRGLGMLRPYRIKLIADLHSP